MQVNSANTSDEKASPLMYGHYRLGPQIGMGGMGAVYLADDLVLDRKVALKILLAEVAQDKERIRRFIQEAKAVSALNHPNILTIFEIGEAHGTHYLVTEFIKGQTLRELIRKGSPDLSKKIDVGIQAAAALDAAHRNGIIHRDIKPENIMVRGDGLVKVLDFGLAKLARKTDRAMSDAATLEHYKTGPGIVVGTAAYMSPEQARGFELDGRSDMFSLGTVLYELVTGRHPFPGESHADIVSAILREEPTPVSQRAPEIPEQFERIIDKLLRKDRDHRYQDIRDLKVDLEDLKDEIRFESKSSHSKPPPVVEVESSAKDTSFISAFTSAIVVKPRFNLLHALLVMVLGAIGIAGVWYFAAALFPPPPEPGSYPTSEIAIWSSSAGELSTDARFSPDGNLIAYSSTRSGSLNIWVTQATSPNSIQVTNEKFSSSDPIWSPKGDEIAFYRGKLAESDQTTSGIWVIPAFGGTPRLVGEVQGGQPTLRKWSRSGKIYFELGSNLFSMDLKSGSATQLTSFEKNSVVWIDIAEDEKSIAYLQTGNGNWTIYVSATDGMNPKEAAKGEGDIGSVVWSRNTEQFFYGSKVAGVRQIFRTDGRGGNAIRITALETDCSIKDVSPDGRSIIYASAKEEADIWRVTLQGKETPIVKDLEETLWPSVSPDNQHIAFQSIRTMVKGDKFYQTSISVKETNAVGDANRSRVIAEKGFLPTWSPVRSEVAFLRSDEKGEGELMIADSASGGTPRSLAKPVPMLGFSVSPYNSLYGNGFQWSPDGSSIVFPSLRNGILNLWRVVPGSGSEEQLTNNADTRTKYFSPIWSSDGKRIAYYFQTSSEQPKEKPVRGIKIVDVESGTSADIYSSSSTFRLLGWSEDETSILIVSGEKEFSSQQQDVGISSISVADRSLAEVATIPRCYFLNFFLSADRKWIAYSGRNDNLDDIWIVPSKGGNARKLTANNDPDVFYSRLAWQPDGNAIVFGKQTRFSLLSHVTEIN